jgi:hypothetical protein
MSTFFCAIGGGLLGWCFWRLLIGPAPHYYEWEKEESD